MHTPRQKLTSRRGETLAEVLVAMLIIALAVLLLAATVTTAGGINMRTRARDAHFYAELSAAETRAAYDETGAAAPTPRPYEVSIQVYLPNGSSGWVPDGTAANVSVTLYGGDHLLTYQTTPAPAPAPPAGGD